MDRGGLGPEVEARTLGCVGRTGAGARRAATARRDQVGELGHDAGRFLDPCGHGVEGVDPLRPGLECVLFLVGQFAALVLGHGDEIATEGQQAGLGLVDVALGSGLGLGGQVE